VKTPIARKTVPLVLVLVSACGCGKNQVSAPPRTPEKPPGDATIQTEPDPSQTYVPELMWVMSERVTSQDKKVALQVSVHSNPGNPDLYHLTLGLQNRSSEPLTVIKPGLRRYWSATEEVTLVGPGGKCEFNGPVPSEPPLDESSLVTLAPFEQTGVDFDLRLSNYESADRDGVYKVRCRYAPGPADQVEALRKQNPSLWYEEMQAGDLAFYRGDDPTPTEFDRNVTIRFPVEEYRFTLAEAAAGVPLNYEIDVAKDFTGAVTPLDTGSGMRAGASGLAPFYRIYGNGQSYSLFDMGLGPPPDYASHPISEGRYPAEFTWDGRNWSGPSDTQLPMGPPFPPGEYTLEVRVAGCVDLPEGRRTYDLRNHVPVILVK